MFDDVSMTTVAGDAGAHGPQVGPRPHAGGMASEAAGDGYGVLRDSDRRLQRARWLTGMAQRTAWTARRGVVRNPVLEVAAAAPAHRRIGLCPGAERPFEVDRELRRAACRALV